MAYGLDTIFSPSCHVIDITDQLHDDDETADSASDADDDDNDDDDGDDDDEDDDDEDDEDQDADNEEDDEVLNSVMFIQYQRS